MDFNEIENWGTEAISDFIDYCDYFIEKDGNFSKTAAKIKKSQEFLAQPDHKFNVFIRQMALDSMEPDKFYLRLKQYLVEVLNLLRENQHLMDTKLKSHLERCAQYNWIFINMTPMVKESPEKIMVNSLVSAVNLMADIGQSIKKSDIKELSVKDKIGAIKSLSFVYKVLKDFQPERGRVFKDFNIVEANKDDAERKALEYANESQE